MKTKLKRSSMYVAAVLALLAIAATATAKRGGKPGPSAEVDSAGNNLSFPVIWSDGLTKTLRGTYGEPVFGTSADDYYVFPDDPDQTKWYLQQDPDNSWQAQSVSPADPVNVTWIDWGDNLESKDWTDGSMVRVETVLYQDLTTPMDEFEMSPLYGSGINEMWGTNTSVIDGYQATVYSGCARLTIQKLTADPDTTSLDLTWDPATGQWTGTGIQSTVLNSPVWDAVEGSDSPDSYSAEINVAGKVIYGYTWATRQSSDGPGFYRITFSLDDVNGPVDLNTFFVDGVTQIMPSSEETEVRVMNIGVTEEPGGGGTTHIDFDKNLTYIDIQLLDKSTGSGGGNGPGGGSGNGGNNGARKGKNK